MDQKEKNPLYKTLDELEQQGCIPYKIHQIIQQKRWQWAIHPSGIHFFVPIHPLEMGRYNDPTSQTGICYTADHAVVAIAESLGRLFQNNKLFIIGLSDLKNAQICTLETNRTTKIIDMPRLQGILHITADKMMGKDYQITQTIVDWAANTPFLDYDGISYFSRHYLGLCTAFWQRKGLTPPLIDIARCSIDCYLDSDSANFPQYWHDSDISGLEIITETLKFSINQED